MNIKVNKYHVCETLESILSQMGVYYVPSKANKKKIKEFFQSMPFFFFDESTQNILYKIIEINNVSSYIDSAQSFKTLCYNIYHDFCVKYKVEYKTYHDFYYDIIFKLNNDKYYIKRVKQNNIHTFVFLATFIGVSSMYYQISKNI